MKLKSNIDLEQFFACVEQCKGQVTFHSPENDILNLRSRLCLYLFTVAYSGSGPALVGEICCQDTEDEKRLSPFMERDENG